MGLINSQMMDSGAKHAVIDVGSNSVRLVIYRMIGSAFIPIHNEKVLAALGSGAQLTNTLSKEGVEMAMSALLRFKILIDALEITQYSAIATAAVRAANDGPAFIERVQNEIGLTIEIISGEDEGRLSQMGVMLGAPNSDGFMGDLGGSSLELVYLNANQSAMRESWQLGPLAMGEISLSKNTSKSIDLVREKIRETFALSNVIKIENLKQFHAVGGAWRSIAHIHMVFRNYPLHVLHNYTIERADILQICDFLSIQSKKSIEKIAGVSSRRADTLPYAAVLLSELVMGSNCQEVVISSYGLREGILAQVYNFDATQISPLVESAKAIAIKDSSELYFSQTLFSWIKPIIEYCRSITEFGFQKQLFETLCTLSCIGIDLHPDHRAFLAYELVLRAPFAAIYHKERVFLACAIAARYGARAEEIAVFDCANLIEKDAAFIAYLIGTAIRFGANLASNSGNILQNTSLQIKDNIISLNLANNYAGLYSQLVEKRHSQLASILGLGKAVTISDM